MQSFKNNQEPEFGKLCIVYEQVLIGLNRFCGEYRSEHSVSIMKRMTDQKGYVFWANQYGKWAENYSPEINKDKSWIYVPE